eukprot:g1980.t1
MLCRLATTASRRATVTAGTSAASPRQQALLSTSLVVCGRPSSSTAVAGSPPLRAPTTAAAATNSTAALCGAEPAATGTRNLSSSSSAAAAESRSAGPKLVFGIPRVDDDVERTPPMEQEDSGPVIREMRVQLRPPSEQGSRGARRIRRAGKVPGIVYSKNDMGANEKDTMIVKVDKIVLDREIRRLGASFDNTVYHLVVEGAQPSGDESGDSEGINIAVQDSAGGKGEGEEAQEGAPRDEAEERRELVIANQSRLHPVFRSLLSVNWIRYKAGRKYPIPIKFINSDLNDNFRKGAYIRRLKTHQHIVLPDDPEKVPKWLYLDLEFVRSGSKLRVSDILMPEGIRLHRGNEAAMWNEVVCTIKGRKVFASDDSAGVEVDDEV